MKIKTIIAGLGLLASFNAYSLDVGVGAKVGTLGTGADISIALTQTINARLALTRADTDFDETLELDDDDTQAEIDATLDLDFGATALLFDWYVFDGTFHLTAGMIQNDSKIKLNGDLVDDTVTFGGTSYNVSQDFEDASISGEVSAGEDFEPYIGFGWGRKADDDPGFSVSIEVGLMLMDPTVDLEGPTVSAANPNNIDQAALDADVDEAESAANDEISDLEVYPVLSIGFNYAF